MNIVPSKFTAVMAGAAMFDVFGSAFKGAFSGKFKSGAVVAFFIVITNASILNIGAPFWAIIFGVITSLVVERNDFTFLAQKKEGDQDSA